MPRGCFAATIALCAPLALGDIVVLHDGRMFEGFIKENNNERVVLDTAVAGIRTDMVFRRAEVVSVKVAPVKPGALGADPPAAPAPQESGVRYVEIPIRGEFGTDVLPRAVSAILAQCARQGVQHVILRIDSPGGQVWAAKELAEVLQRETGGIQVHAVITRALSAAVWPVFTSDTIWMLPGSTVGAAVAFSKNTTSGAAQVDAKFNSALAASLASVAEGKKRSPVLARAMTVMDAKAWWYKDESGAVQIVGERPSGSIKDVHALDSERTVLTLTRSDAVAIGFARPLDEYTLDSLREALAIEAWSKASVPAETLMKTFADTAKDLKKEIAVVVEEIGAKLTAANANDPYKFNYKVDKEGFLTPDSCRRWQQLTDQCSADLRSVRALILRLNGLSKRAAETGLDFWLEELGKERIRWTLAEIDARLTKLRKERSITRPPAQFESKK